MNRERNVIGCIAAIWLASIGVGAAEDLVKLAAPGEANGYLARQIGSVRSQDASRQDRARGRQQCLSPGCGGR
jgi:hypothetical protein